MEDTSRIFSFLHHQEKKFGRKSVQSSRNQLLLSCMLGCLLPYLVTKQRAPEKGREKKDDNNLDFVRFVVSRKVHHPLLSLLGRRR